MKLKWYDWDGVSEIPSGATELMTRGGYHYDREFLISSSINHRTNPWCLHIGDEYDIIAYTLGEPLEKEDE